MSQEVNFSKGWGISGFVVSIVAIFPFLFMPYFGIFMSIYSIVAFFLQRKIQNTGLGVAGLVIGIIGFLINLLMLFMVLALIGAGL